METPSRSASSSSTSSTEALPHHRTVVLKIGTSTLMGAEGPNAALLERLADVVAALACARNRCVIVTSGAVGTGRWRLRAPGKPKSIPEKQAAAAIGQGLLMHAYERVLEARGLVSAQLLLTRQDLSDRQRYVNASNTLGVLLSAETPVVPIINENDSVAVDELKFGDNDTLSALVANLVNADHLFILSDVDGLYEADPRKDPQARRLEVVPVITPEIAALAGGAGTSLGTGGMATKIAAATIATSCGIPVVLLSGQAPEDVLASLGGALVGTTFLATGSRLEGRKRWLAFGGRASGRLVVDDGAARAIAAHGKSLLPAGIRAVEGNFGPGSLVVVEDAQGRELARGLVNYGADEMDRIRGHKSGEIEAVLGYKAYDEAIHRDNMVVV